MNEALQKLQNELDKTSVISEEFKTFIMAWAIEACRIAFEAGKNSSNKT